MARFAEPVDHDIVHNVLEAVGNDVEAAVRMLQESGLALRAQDTEGPEGALVFSSACQARALCAWHEHYHAHGAVHDSDSCER